MKNTFIYIQVYGFKEKRRKIWHDIRWFDLNIFYASSLVSYIIGLGSRQCLWKLFPSMYVGRCKKKSRVNWTKSTKIIYLDILGSEIINYLFYVPGSVLFMVSWPDSANRSATGHDMISKLNAYKGYSDD